MSKAFRAYFCAHARDAMDPSQLPSGVALSASSLRSMVSDGSGNWGDGSPAATAAAVAAAAAGVGLAALSSGAAAHEGVDEQAAKRRRMEPVAGGFAASAAGFAAPLAVLPAGFAASAGPAMGFAGSVPSAAAAAAAPSHGALATQAGWSSMPSGSMGGVGDMGGMGGMGGKAKAAVIPSPRTRHTIQPYSTPHTCRRSPQHTPVACTPLRPTALASPTVRAEEGPQMCLSLRSTLLWHPSSPPHVLGPVCPASPCASPHRVLRLTVCFASPYPSPRRVLRPARIVVGRRPHNLK